MISGRDPEWEAAYRTIQGILNRYIDRALEQQTIEEIEAEDGGFIQEDPRQHPFSMLHELANDTQDHEYIRNQLLNVFIPA